MTDSLYLLDSLHLLISNNVVSEKAYSSRYKGFNAELDFLRFYNRIKTKSNFYTGGYFLPIVPGHPTLVEPVYFTVCSDDPVAYIPIYKAVSKLNCKRLFYIRFNSSVDIAYWKKENLFGVEVPVPEFSVYEFFVDTEQFTASDLSSLLSLYAPKDRPTPSGFSIDSVNHAQKLNVYPYADLLQLYVGRLIFDGYLGFRYFRGIASDIDGIIENEGELYFLEVKEKDLSKSGIIGFGMDVDRMESLAEIMEKTGFGYFYLVRQVKDQIHREFLAWRQISMKAFILNAVYSKVNGGAGMRLEGRRYQTKICPDSLFKKLNEI